MLNTFQWPHGEKSGAAIDALCANARFIVPLLASGYLGLTLRAARSPHSLIACFVPFQMLTYPGGIFCCSRDEVNAWSKRRSPNRIAASVPSEYFCCSTARAVAIFLSTLSFSHVAVSWLTLCSLRSATSISPISSSSRSRHGATSWP